MDAAAVSVNAKDKYVQPISESKIRSSGVLNGRTIRRIEEEVDQGKIETLMKVLRIFKVEDHHQYLKDMPLGQKLFKLFMGLVREGQEGATDLLSKDEAVIYYEIFAKSHLIDGAVEEKSSVLSLEGPIPISHQILRFNAEYFVYHGYGKESEVNLKEYDLKVVQSFKFFVYNLSLPHSLSLETLFALYKISLKFSMLPLCEAVVEEIARYISDPKHFLDKDVYKIDLFLRDIGKSYLSKCIKILCIQNYLRSKQCPIYFELYQSFVCIPISHIKIAEPYDPAKEQTPKKIVKSWAYECVNAVSFDLKVDTDNIECLFLMDPDLCEQISCIILVNFDKETFSSVTLDRIFAHFKKVSQLIVNGKGVSNGKEVVSSRKFHDGQSAHKAIFIDDKEHVKHCHICKHSTTIL